MILFFAFLFFLFFENLLLPALTGPQEFLITPLFLIGMVVYSPRLKLILIEAGIFMFVAEIFSGVNIGNFLIPFGLTILVYLWLNRYLDMSSSLRDNFSFVAILNSSLVIILLLYLYSWIYVFFNSSYDLSSAWSTWKTLVWNSFFQTLGWSLAFTLLFKYVLKIK